MKALAFLLLCIVSLSVVACSAPSADAPREPAAAPTTPNSAPGVSAPEVDPVAEQLTSRCDDTIDPQVMVNAFPSTFEGLSVVGDIMADKSAVPMDDGNVERGSNALKTLTKDDEYYVTFAGTDACGLNIGKGMYNQLVVGPSDYGYVKEATVKGYSGLIVFDEGSGIYAFDVLLKNRLVVEVTADGPEGEAQLLRAAQQVDYKAIEQAMP